jgi:hypothetical protein
MDTNEHEKLRNEPQMDADKMGLLRSSQENLAKFGRWMVRSLTDFAKEMNELYPEIYNRKLLNERNRSRHYLRKSAVCF